MVTIVLILVMKRDGLTQWEWTTNENGMASIVMYTGTNDVITVPREVKGIAVNRIERDAFSISRRRLVSVDTGDVIDEIPGSMFMCCDSLTNIVIGSGVRVVQWLAFMYCYSLKTVRIPDGVTAIGERAFMECTSLTNVTIGCGVTNIGDEAFAKCVALKTVCFAGDAPICGKDVFEGTQGVTVYYVKGKKGWGKEFGGCQTAFWGEDRVR